MILVLSKNHFTGKGLKGGKRKGDLYKSMATGLNLLSNAVAMYLHIHMNFEVEPHMHPPIKS